MIDLSLFKGSNIAVMGLGKTGISACLALMHYGVNCTAWDDKDSARNDAIAKGINVVDLSTVDISQFEFIIWSPGIAHHHPQIHPVALMADMAGVPIICDIDVLYRVKRNADYIAITGTNGKSTTTALIGHILSTFRKTQVGGNIGTPVFDLENLEQNETYVIEMSSYQAELSPSFAPNAAVLLNITPDHLARHGGMDGYIAAKCRIFANSKFTERKPIAIICIDTDICKDIAQKMHDDNIWTVIQVSVGKKLDRGVYVIDGMLYEQENLIADLTKMPALKGSHNYENAACAYAVLRHLYGFAPADIIKQMAGFAGLQHRQYLVRNINSIAYINDSKATNADATEKALNSFRNIYWILGGQAKEGGLSGLEPYMNRIEHAYLIGEATLQFANFLQKQNVPFTICGTIDNAVVAAHKAAQIDGKGVVLLSPACASWDQFKSFEHRGQVFTDLVNAL